MYEKGTGRVQLRLKVHPEFRFTLSTVQLNKNYLLSFKHPYNNLALQEVDVDLKMMQNVLAGDHLFLLDRQNKSFKLCKQKNLKDKRGLNTVAKPIPFETGNNFNLMALSCVYESRESTWQVFVTGGCDVPTRAQRYDFSLDLWF